MASRAGAKTKQNVPRYPGGQIRHSYREPKAEKPEKIMAVVLAQPHRRGNGSQYAGYAFGRLFLSGETGITERQHRAAEIYMTRTIRYMKHITGSLPNFTSPLANMVKLDLEFQRDPAPVDGRLADEVMRTEEERIADIRSGYKEIQDALADAGMLHDGNRILTRVCVNDREPINDIELGTFRCALNVIANRLRL